MEFAIDFGGDPQDVTITTSGKASLDGFKRMSETLASDPRFRAGLAILMDHCALSRDGMSEDDRRKAAEHIMDRDWTFPPKAIAIVVPDRHAFDLAELALTYLSVLETRRRIFLSHDEALGWLREQKSLVG